MEIGKKLEVKKYENTEWKQVHSSLSKNQAPII